MERTDIENMRQIPIADFLARLGHEPVRRSGNELWYRAPYRSERTPSFRVNVAKQLWYDFGLGKGGDIFTLVGEFTRSGDFMAQARFIAETARMPLAAAEKPLYLPEPSEPAFEGVEAVPLLRSPLTDYLAERGIPYAVASRHCCRLNYGVRGKRYFAVGFPNVSGGYETRSRRFKGCVPPKDVSLVKAGDIPADVCSVFEGFMDFLSYQELHRKGDYHVCIDSPTDFLVMNSVSNLKKCLVELERYTAIHCYLDNDLAGRKTVETIAGLYGKKVIDHSESYYNYKDLNDYLRGKRR